MMLPTGTSNARMAAKEKLPVLLNSGNFRGSDKIFYNNELEETLYLNTAEFGNFKGNDKGRRDEWLLKLTNTYVFYKYKIADHEKKVPACTSASLESLLKDGVIEEEKEESGLIKYLVAKMGRVRRKLQRKDESQPKHGKPRACKRLKSKEIQSNVVALCRASLPPRTSFVKDDINNFVYTRVFSFPNSIQRQLRIY